jgi:hypothetical protein
MQPDELRARRCRKGENAMAKSLKSRCCKSRCCKRVCPEVVSLILVCTFFPDYAGLLFMS